MCALTNKRLDGLISDVKMCFTDSSDGFWGLFLILQSCVMWPGFTGDM